VGFLPKGVDMNQLNNLVNQIESISFSASMDLFSGFSSFMYEVSNNSLVKELITVVSNTDEGKYFIISRLFYLLSETDGSDYRHRHDVAIAVYLYVVAKLTPDIIIVLTKLVDHTKNLWWASKLAKSLEQNLPSNEALYTFSISPSPVMYTSKSKNAGSTSNLSTFVRTSTSRLVNTKNKTSEVATIGDKV
jgi:hypothetical protein